MEEFLHNLSVPENYIQTALEGRQRTQKQLRLLLEKGKLLDEPLDDDKIKELLRYFSSMDNNNFVKRCCVGEREGRIFSKLVQERNFGFSHGVGKSGNLVEPQPKAVGSSLMSNLVRALLMDVLRISGFKSAKSCLLVPMATGMTLTLCFLSLKKDRPKAKYILWSRIDQRSCFKAITTAGYEPVIIDPLLQGDTLITDVETFKKKILEMEPENIACIYSTSSCFAPRSCDNLSELGKLAKTFDIPHIVNNAYGLQSTWITHQIESVVKETGRIDLFVMSTDKNLMTPVGGAIVVGFFKDSVESIASTYAGRASSSQTIDVLITLLSMGKHKYLSLIKERKEAFVYLHEKLEQIASKYEERLLLNQKNPISCGITLKNVVPGKVSLVGSMLYKRGVSGSRVVTCDEVKTVANFEFENWGSHSSQHIGVGYITAAATLGLTKEEVDTFVEKLDTVLTSLRNEIKA